MNNYNHLILKSLYKIKTKSGTFIPGFLKSFYLEDDDYIMCSEYNKQIGINNNNIIIPLVKINHPIYVKRPNNTFFKQNHKTFNLIFFSFTHNKSFIVASGFIEYAEFVKI